MNIYDIAYNIWEDLSEPCDLAPSYISGWLVNQTNIGKLNTLLGTCFSGVDSTISPEIQPDEAAVYSEIYKQVYWKKKMNENMSTDAIHWTTMKEGDSTITRANPADIAKVYQSMVKQSSDDLRNLILSYKSNGGFPRSVNFAPA